MNSETRTAGEEGSDVVQMLGELEKQQIELRKDAEWSQKLVMVVGALLLGFFGFTSFFQVPLQVKSSISEFAVGQTAAAIKKTDVEAKAYASEIAQLRITAEENVRALSSIAAVTATEIGVLRDDTTVRFFVATGSTNTALATFIHTVKGPKPVGIHALHKVLDGQSGVLITLIFGPDSPQKGQSFTVALAQSGMTNTNSIIRPH